MFGSLAGDVQVRKESWGLLFYSSSRHKIRFVRSGNWLYPYHFDGTWTFEAIVEDISKRSLSPTDSVQHNILKLIKNLEYYGLMNQGAIQPLAVGLSH
jgi:hypothetical protein